MLLGDHQYYRLNPDTKPLTGRTMHVFDPISFARRVLLRATASIEGAVNPLHEAITHARTIAGTYDLTPVFPWIDDFGWMEARTSTDLPAGVNASEIEAAYPLTPMQAGMLFHHLYMPTSDAYFGQAHWPSQRAAGYSGLPRGVATGRRAPHHFANIVRLVRAVRAGATGPSRCSGPAGMFRLAHAFNR